MLKKILFIAMISLIFSLTALPALADGPDCDDDYTVQAGDWLSKISDHYFGNMMEFDSIVATTNLASDSDGSYSHIDDPDKIDVGQKLCIPKKDNADSIKKQIKNAESAAPEKIGEHSTVFGDVNGSRVMLRQGTNNWECDPDWLDSPMNDPICIDELAKGWNDAAFGYNGSAPPFPMPTPAFSYMLQGGGDAVDWNADPLVWETYPPHAIVIFPNLSDTDSFTTDPFNGGPWVMSDASPFEHIMVPVVREKIPYTTDKIANALSALPAELAADATVLDLALDANGDFVVLREGSNGWYCWPDWDVSPTNDPMCGDEMWLDWNLEFSNGREPNTTKPGIAYMLQGGSDASNTDPYASAPADGEDWVISPPHIMVLYPGGFDATYISTDPKNGGPYIMWDGTPYEHIMYPVRVK